jgi:hypothetical protein
MAPHRDLVHHKAISSSIPSKATSSAHKTMGMMRMTMGTRRIIMAGEGMT